MDHKNACMVGTNKNICRAFYRGKQSECVHQDY